MSSPSQPPSSPSLKELRAARGRPPSGLRRFRKWIIAGALLLALILFGFFGLPPIVRAQAVKQLSSRLGRKVTIERVRINPLVLSATIEGFAIAEADPAAGEFAGWRRFHVNFDSWPLLLGRIRFQEIALDGFHARVAKDKTGGLNFNDIVDRLTAPDPAAPPPAPKDPNARPRPFAIGHLAVTDAQVSFDDASGDRPFATVVGPLTFSLDNFFTVGGPDSPYQFEAVTEAGERLAWRGTVSANPVRSRGELVLANIDLAHLSPYYHQLVKGELRSAFADLEGRYTFELKDGAPVLTFADGALTLREVRFGAPGVADDAFALKRLALTGVSADSVARKASIAKIEIGGINVKATRDAGGIDLVRLLGPGGTEAKNAANASNPPAPAAPAPQPAVTVGELSLSGVQAELTDLTTPRRAVHHIDDLVLTLRDLDSANLAREIPFTLEVKLPEEGRVALSGKVAPQPLAAELEIAAERVPLAHVSPYVEPFINVRLAGGTLRSRGKVSLHEGKAGFVGDLGVGGFASVDGKLAQDFVKWTDLSLDGVLVATEPLSLHADKIRLLGPYALVRIEADGSLSVAPVSPPAPKEKEPAGPIMTVRIPVDHPATKPESSTLTAPVVVEQNPLPFALTVDRFEIEGGAFRFEDRSVKPAARGGLVDFSGSLSGLSSGTLGQADVDLHGKVDGVAPVSVTGKLNPLGSPAFVDLKVDFKGIDLQPGGGPYIGKFTGRDLERGSLSLAVKAKLDERKVDVTNVVTLDQFYLGSKNNSPDATKLPVGLALSLLRDTDGRIVVDLPIRGSLDDPSFKIGRVVLRVLTNILAKAATSPFSLLGAAFGGGGDELGWQDFGAGQTKPDQAGIKKLETVAKAMNGRPALNVEIAGAYDPVNDLAALRFERLDAQVRATAWETRRQVDPNTPPPEQLEITPQIHAGMVAKLYAEAFPSEAAAPGSGDGAAGQASPAPVARPAAPPAEEPASRLKVGRLPRFYVKGDYARGAPVPGTASPAPAPSGKDSAGTAGPKDGKAASADAADAPAPVVPLDEMEARLAARIEIPPADLQAVGEARALAIRAWLVEAGKVAPERVLLAPVVATGMRVNLNLK